MRQDFKISYSRVNSYLFCPYKYKLLYLDNLYIPITPEITFGHIVHKALELFHKGKLHFYKDLFDSYNNAWRNDGFSDPQQVFEFYKRGESILKNYYKSLDKLNTNVLHVERAFDSNVGKYRFVGIIDRIDENDGVYEVIDYKTHSKIWQQERVDKDLQLSLYAYACKNVFDINPDKISVYFLSENRKIYTKRSQSEISQAIDIAINTAENVLAENFNPNTSKCEMCDFKLKCKFSRFKNENQKEEN